MYDNEDNHDKCQIFSQIDPCTAIEHLKQIKNAPQPASFAPIRDSEPYLPL